MVNDSKKSPSKSVFFDILVTVICLIAFFLSVFAFYGAITQTLENQNETPIGTVSFKYKTAQRKLLDRVLWDRIKTTSPIYNGDLLRTEELAEATVTFSDGNSIELYGQTLAQFFLDKNEGLSIDFTEGDIFISTQGNSNGVTIKSDIANFDVQGSSLVNIHTIQENDAKIAVQVVNGSVIRSDDSSTGFRTYSEGEVLFLDEDGNDVEQLMMLESPLPNAKYLKQLNENVKVPFAWNTSSDLDKTTKILELSKKKSFSKIAERHTFTTEKSIALELPIGTCYYRFYTDNIENAIIGNIKILDAPKTEYITPKNQENISYRTNNPPIRFTWSDDDYALSWEFKVADNAEMKNPIITQKTKQPSSIISRLSEGTWYWTAVPNYSQSMIPQKTDKHAPNSFIIKKKDILTPTLLGFPNNNAEIQFDTEYYFSWLHDFEASLYTITISKDSNLTTPSYEVSTSNNYISISENDFEFSEGTWYWAVTKFDNEGNSSEQSEIRSFSIKTENPILRSIFPPNYYEVEENNLLDILFTWKTNVSNDLHFQISKEQDFKSIEIEKILQTTTTNAISLPEGTWYWRVISKNDGQITHSSEVNKLMVVNNIENIESNIVVPKDTIQEEISISPKKKVEEIETFELLPKVSNIQPVNNTILDIAYFTEKDYITFSWNAVKNADAYIFIVKNYKNQILISEELENITEFTFNDISKLHNGEYSISIEAINYENNSKIINQHGEVAKQIFSVDIPMNNTASQDVTGELYGL